MKRLQRIGWMIQRRWKDGMSVWKDDSGLSVIEMLLILVGIFTPYYRMGIRCMA